MTFYEMTLLAKSGYWGSDVSCETWLSVNRFYAKLPCLEIAPVSAPVEGWSKQDGTPSFLLILPRPVTKHVRAETWSTREAWYTC